MLKGREENRGRGALELELELGSTGEGKVGVQLGPIRVGPHVPAGGVGGGGPKGAGGSREGSGEEVLRAMGLDLVKLY